MATYSVELRDPRERSGGEGDAGASASLRDAVPRVAQLNPSGSRNKGLGTSSAAARDAQHHVATLSSPKPLLRLLSTQPFLRQAPKAAGNGRYEWPASCPSRRRWDRHR